MWTGLVDPLNQWVQLITLLIILVSVLAEGAGISFISACGVNAMCHKLCIILRHSKRICICGCIDAVYTHIQSDNSMRSFFF